MNRIVKLIAKPFNLCLSSVSPSCIGRWTNISFVLMLTAFWLVGIPAGAKSITTVSSQSNVVAVADTSMVAYIEKKTGFQIPAEYRNKIDSILKNDIPIIDVDGINSRTFTVDFVLNEMKSDWGISKENQFLFIMNNIICKLLTGKSVIKIDSDGLKDYETAVTKIRLCRDRYKEGIMPFIDKQKAEYRRQIAENERQIAEYDQQIAESQKRIDEALKQSAEAHRQSAEARRQSAEMIPKIIKGCNETLGIYKELYPIFKEHPGDERLKKFKSNAQKLIPICKEYGVNYKAVLSAEILKFYGIEE